MRHCKNQRGDERTAVQAGFSLLEVMIAVGIFFMVSFAVLALVSRCLKQAAALEHVHSPITAIAAQTTSTNQLEEGVETGDFGEVFPEYRWTREVVLLTNGLYEVYLNVSRSGQSKPDSELTIRVFLPQGGAPGAPGRRR